MSLTYESVQDISLLTRASALIADYPAPFAGQYSRELTIAAYAIELGCAGEWEATLVTFAKAIVLSRGRRT